MALQQELVAVLANTDEDEESQGLSGSTSYRKRATLLKLLQNKIVADVRKYDQQAHQHEKAKRTAKSKKPQYNQFQAIE